MAYWRPGVSPLRRWGDDRQRHQAQPGRLLLRSLKNVHKAPAVGPWFGLGPSPDPGAGAGVELGGGGPGGVGGLVGGGEGLAGQRPAPEEPPPPSLQVEAADALGEEEVGGSGSG